MHKHNRCLKIFFVALLSLTPGFLLAEEETLELYWPLQSPGREWILIAKKDKDLAKPTTQMKVINKDALGKQVELWFSDKPGQPVKTSDVERYVYCGNPGGDPWLFLLTYIDVGKGAADRSHPVQATRILFTPENGSTVDLIAEGTYGRCGGKGQPYLRWNLNLETYRIQVWGTLIENPKWKWYWDATVSKPAPVTNDCLTPAQTVKALKVQEVWWSNFKVEKGKWGMGAGDVDGEGLPTGAHIVYGRTVWHAQGQLPYYLIGRPDGKTINWCVHQVVPTFSTVH
jgi:hypothetical protein